jgi:hypothetical protein
VPLGQAQESFRRLHAVIDLTAPTEPSVHGPVLDVGHLTDAEITAWMRALGALLRREARTPELRGGGDRVRRARLTEELGRLATEARRREVACTPARVVSGEFTNPKHRGTHR